jgi:hypothetical protein
VLIDGQYIEPQSGRDKISYECGCLNKSTQCIVWGFVLSEDHEAQSPPPLINSPPPLVQRIAAPRVKVVMQRQKTQGGAASTRVEALLADNIPVGSSSEHPPPSSLDLQGQNLEPVEEWYHFGEGSDKILPSLFGQSNSSFVVLNAN